MILTETALKFTVDKEAIVKPLQLISNVVDRKQALPILSNVLISVKNKKLCLTGTDSEVEITSHASILQLEEEGEITVPAKKLADICKSFPDGKQISFALDKNQLIISVDRSRFALATLPATQFPKIKNDPADVELSVSQNELKHLLEKTYFAMAQQDVRYYLNGLLIEINQQDMKSIATDGHRLALDKISLKTNIDRQIIIPRKGVIEMMRLLEENEKEISIYVSHNHIRIKTEEFVFTSKLIESKFPNYNAIIPKKGDKIITADKELLKQSLSRISILTHEKYKGIRVCFSNNLIKLFSNNSEHESAEEEINANYNGDPIEIALNIVYLQEAIAAISGHEVKITCSNQDSSILIEENSSTNNKLYVIMPMRL